MQKTGQIMKPESIDLLVLSRADSLDLYKADDIDLSKLSKPDERMMALFLWHMQAYQDYKYPTQMKPYFKWAIERDAGFLQPEFWRFAQDMKARGYNQGTIKHHIGKMRRAYRDLLRRRDFKEFLRQYAQQMHPDDPAARMELISDYRLDILDALEESTDLKDRRIKRMDDFNWLTPEQQAQLLNLPNTQTLRGTRDAAMISILLATGIRRIELAHLQVRHLKQKEHGNWALKLETVKTAADFIKERSVIWGEWLFCLEDYVYPWLNAAGINEGYVFRGIKGKTRLMKPPIHVAMVNQVLKRYPITIGEATDYIQPHSLRRTYARSQYDAGMDIKSIALNMGHESTITTDRYIGGTDVEARAGRFSLPKGFAQIVRGEKARKRERAHRGMTTERKWASIVMRTLERSRDGWFWLKEISSGVSRGQRVNISNAVSRLKAEGKIKKWKMPKPGGGHKRGLMISLPEDRYHPNIRRFDDTTLNARLIILYPVEVD